MCINHYEFVSENNMVKKYNEKKEEIKVLENTLASTT